MQSGKGSEDIEGKVRRESAARFKGKKSRHSSLHRKSQEQRDRETDTCKTSTGGRARMGALGQPGLHNKIQLKKKKKQG